METKWILKLIEQITAPMRSVQSHSEEAAEAVNQVSAEANAASEAIADIVKPAQAAAKAAGKLEDAFDESSDGAARLKKNVDAIKKAIEHYKGKLEVETDLEEIRAAKVMLEEYKKQLKELDDLPNSEKSKKNWGDIALAANQTFEIAEKVVDALDFANEISNLQTSIQQMTDATGDELTELTRKTYRLAKIFQMDSEEIARAANSMSDQVGGTFQENLALIQAGLEKGANLNGDFLDQLKEYGPQLKAAGLTGSQSVALMVKAGKDGIFSDKAIDAIKEANLSLREMGQPQIDALHAVGLKVKDVAGKTTFEAVQMITKAMATAPIQAKQMVLTDIFKGAGEDAGLKFVEGLSAVNMDINNIPSVKQAGESTKGFLADMESWFATTFSGIAGNVSTFGSIGAMLAGFLPIFSAIRTSTMGVAIATNVASAAQWLWNAAFLASPIGWIVMGLAAVTAGVLLAWKHFSGFREVVTGLWEVFKQVFDNIAGLFKAVFGPIGEAIQAIKEGRFADAAKAAIQLNPVSMLVNAGKYVANGGLNKGVGDAYEKGKKAGADSFKADQADKKKDPAKGLVNMFTDGANKPQKVKLDGKLFDAKTGTMGGSGLELNGMGSGGGKSITMHLTFNNRFAVSDKLDIRKVADEIAGIINDRLRDGAINIG